MIHHMKVNGVILKTLNLSILKVGIRAITGTCGVQARKEAGKSIFIQCLISVER